MADSESADRRHAVEKRRKAHRAANRLIVGAAILLADAGVPPYAPEMKALSAALRAVNRAAGIPSPKSEPEMEKKPTLRRPTLEEECFRRAAT
jgi:hypothetical protein